MFNTHTWKLMTSNSFHAFKLGEGVSF